MNFFRRLKRLFSGFFENLISHTEEENHEHMIQGVLKEYGQKLHLLRESMVTLRFQERKMGESLRVLRLKIKNFQLNTEKAIKAGDDALALRIISYTEGLQEEESFLEKQYSKITSDVKEAEVMEKDLTRRISRAESELRSLGTRITSLKMRKKLQQELAVVTGGLKEFQNRNSLQKLQDQALRLEIEVEGSSGELDLNQINNELEMNSERERHVRKLEQLKNKLGVPKPVLSIPTVLT